MLSPFAKRLLDDIRSADLLRPGDRVGVAVSGGADSVALLRSLIELRSELGIILKVLHFNHGIRGLAAAEDEEFVRALAGSHGLESILGSADTPTHGRREQLGLEAAARSLRYRFFREQIAAGAVDKVATAHTLDDQAETLLLRLLRGAGPRGLRGIHATTGEGIVRPMLGLRRDDVEKYLRDIRQEWREDATNADIHHARNRVRHELLPLLAREFNPKIAETLARTAEVLRAEEEFLDKETLRLLPLLLLPGKPVRGGGRDATGEAWALAADKLYQQPLALRRRVVRAVADRFGVELGLQHVDEVLGLDPGGRLRLQDQWQATRSQRELRFERTPQDANAYEYPLTLPGEVRIEEMRIVVRARLLPMDSQNNRGTLDALTLPTSAAMIVRNWHARDRYRQSHASSEHKVKELLQEIQPPSATRGLWPVVAADGNVVWLMGARNRPLRTASGERIVIDTVEIG